jgi:hypothetical protein
LLEFVCGRRPALEKEPKGTACCLMDEAKKKTKGRDTIKSKNPLKRGF